MTTNEDLLAEFDAWWKTPATTSEVDISMRFEEELGGGDCGPESDIKAHALMGWQAARAAAIANTITLAECERRVRRAAHSGYGKGWAAGRDYMRDDLRTDEGSDVDAAVKAAMKGGE